MAVVTIVDRITPLSPHVGILTRGGSSNLRKGAGLSIPSPLLSPLLSLLYRQK